MGLYDFVRFESRLPAGYEYSVFVGGVGWSQTKSFDEPRMRCIVVTNLGWAINQTFERDLMIGDILFWAVRTSDSAQVRMVARFSIVGLEWFRESDIVGRTDGICVRNNDSTRDTWQRIAGPGPYPNDPDADSR